MTDADLISALVRQQALIVHCSMTGKAGGGPDTLVFPDDLLNAIDVFAHKGIELCCSVIWPGHVKTVGAIGIILKPRSTASITRISKSDAGSSIDPSTGLRGGFADPFSSQAVETTFQNAKSYNEWFVKDADAIGVFIHSGEPLIASKRVPLSSIVGFEEENASLFGSENPIDTVVIEPDEIRRTFPDLPAYTVTASGILRLDLGEPRPVSSGDLYR